VLTLSNPTEEPVAFKARSRGWPGQPRLTALSQVKTTAPKKYCVRPNTGVAPPGGSVEVAVTMQSMSKAPEGTRPAELRACLV